jgi:hypothetical protein
MMRTPIPEIEVQLAALGIPDQLIALHCQRVAAWRAAHPQKIRRKRLYDDPLSAFAAKPKDERPHKVRGR